MLLYYRRDVIVPRKLALLQWVVVTIHVASFRLQIILIYRSILPNLVKITTITRHLLTSLAINSWYVQIDGKNGGVRLLRPYVPLQLFLHARAPLPLKQGLCIH